MKIPGLMRFRQSVLAFSILRLVLLVSLVVFILATTLGVIQERNRALDAAHEQARTTVLNGLNSVSIVLWNYDQPGWTTLLEGMVRTSSIARIELFDTTGLLADVRDANTQQQVSEVWSEPVMAPDGKSQIGQLRVSESQTAVNRQITGLVSTLVTAELAKIIGLSFSLLAIVYWRVARHLDRLAKDVVRLAPNDLDTQLRLDRTARGGKDRDELDILVEAINSFLRDRAAEVRRRAVVESDLVQSEATSRKLLEQTRQLLAENRTIINNAVIGIVFLKERHVVSCNQRLEEIFQYKPGELLGCSTETFYDSPETFEDVGKRAYNKLSEGENYSSEVKLKHKDGSIFWGSMSGRAIDPLHPQDGSIWVYSDISERKAAEERINQLAFFDQLTGLPNRTLLLDRLHQVMASNARSGAHAALLFVDLDRFKTVNDTLGHDVGDRLLKQVALRLLACVRSEDTVARFGGDEYIVLLTGLSAVQRDAVEQADVVGQKILARLREVYQLDPVNYFITPSIGITLFVAEPADTDALLIQADIAMYRMKEVGRNGLRFFDPEMENAVLQRAALESDLRSAVDQGQFVLHYQPQMGDNRLTGTEALVRWMHPTRGVVSPAEFIPLAEETGLIVDLGYWILREACTQLVIWQAHPRLHHLTVAVNVSAVQFRQVDFVKRVQALLQETGINPLRLKIELTESLFADNIELIIEKMNALKAMGVGLSLDDFGTGFSSLSYLKRFPLDQLKIDQSFVRDVLTDLNDAAIAKTIITLARSLDLDVIAEGVETIEQRDFLTQAGCRMFQGYLFSRPLAAEKFELFALKGQQNDVSMD